MYLFFVRHFNDIDHLAPVAWKMNEDNHPVTVLCMNPRYDYRSDYRLRFLSGRGVTVDYLHTRFHRRRSMLHELLSAYIEKAYARQRRYAPDDQNLPYFKRLYGFLSGQLGLLSYKLIRFGYYNIRWARSFLERFGAQAICFDHVMPGLYVVSNLLKAAKELSIPSFSLPHGVPLYTNEASKPKSTDARRFAKFNRFDYIIVPTRLRRDLLIRSGVSVEKIFVLGSARYSNAWMDQNQRIIPKMIEPTAKMKKRLKIVFLPSKPQCQVDLDRLNATCAILANIENIEVMIKPHTRAGGEKYLFVGNNLPDASHILTAELCEWADVILVVGSSVITEALMRKKPALYLKYLHENTTLFEELGACWTMHDENELRSALLSLQKDKTSVPYGQTSVLNYISEVVWGGSADKDVLGNYEAFIVGHAKN